MVCSNIILLLLQTLHQCARSRVWLHFYPATFYQEGEIPSEIAHIAFADGGNRTWAAFAESQCVIFYSVVSWHGRKKLTCCFFIGHAFRFFGFRGPSFRSLNRNLWRSRRRKKCFVIVASSKNDRDCFVLVYQKRSKIMFSILFFAQNYSFL